MEKQQEEAMHEAEEQPTTAEAEPPPVAQVSHIAAVLTCLPSAAPSLFSPSSLHL